jgi:hypothetical protein
MTPPKAVSSKVNIHHNIPRFHQQEDSRVDLTRNEIKVKRAVAWSNARAIIY